MKSTIGIEEKNLKTHKALNFMIKERLEHVRKNKVSMEEVKK